MDLVGAWLRQLLKAGTAAALVPAAMVAALVVVLIGAGGFGGLGSIRQLLTGPEVPPAEQVASSDAADGDTVAPVAPADERRAARRAARGGSSARDAVPAAPPAQPERRRPPAVDPGAPPIVRPPPPPVVDPLPPPPPPPPPPAATPPPTLEDRVQVLAQKLNGAVGDVSTVLEAIVEELVQTLRRIVTAPPRAAS